MKLSKAIRDGAKGTEQAFGYFVGLNGECCSLGAAIRGAAINPNTEQRDIVKFWDGINMVTSLFPELSDEMRSPEVLSVLAPEPGAMLYAIIVDLNDTWHWTRERQAEWLESIGL